MLQVENLSFSYGSKKVLDDLNLKFEPEKLYAIQGESGAGKTTLLSVLAGIDDRFSGKLIYNDEEIKYSRLKNYNKDHVSIIFQSLNLIDYLTVYENIALAAKIKANKKVEKDEIRKYLELFKLDEVTEKTYPNELSGGQQQRIAIIRGVITESDVIIADEPTGSLDQKNTKIITEELRRLAVEEKKIVIIVTHTKEVADSCDIKYELENGKLVNLD